MSKLWIGVGVSFLLLLGLALYHRGRTDILPPVVKTAVTNEKADRARADSEITASYAEAQAARARQAIAEQRSAALQQMVNAMRTTADREAAQARRSGSPSDSAEHWKAAYDARTTERDTLLAVVAVKDSVIVDVRAEARANLQMATVAQAGRVRADSVLDAVVGSIAHAQCHVPLTFGRVNCPSRRATFVAGIAAALLARPAYTAIRLR